ncbi:uncharacterized protein DSM5745_09437 [Aspergillus mulundensis]|uniref:Uncharacterized protein n=1 Tax=Aspergillus mulundensis TaxID=1810919 RepID=A0A3D8QVG9_9EURO|nr:hypothetical protein DSM5745_09437 [Aspergillus mulundensis]RDW65698.1 hypothetical protein DSM5745_09437 [Aspergillus mulundensis]
MATAPTPTPHGIPVTHPTAALPLPVGSARGTSVPFADSVVAATEAVPVLVTAGEALALTLALAGSVAAAVIVTARDSIAESVGRSHHEPCVYNEQDAVLEAIAHSPVWYVLLVSWWSMVYVEGVSMIPDVRPVPEVPKAQVML